MLLMLSFGGAALAKRPYPALKGLDKVRISSTVSLGVTNQLFRNKAPTLDLSGQLKHLAETKLHEVGVSTANAPEQGPKLSIAVDTDMATDELAVTLTYSDWVSLVRDPAVRFETPLWSRTGHPKTDEASSIKEALDDLLDRFIADRMESTPPPRS
jgi:hypothetical protein